MINLKSIWPFGRKSASANQLEVVLGKFLEAYQSKTGLPVNAGTVMRLSAVYSCVRNLSEDMAKMPLHLYRRRERGKDRAVDHPLYSLLNGVPNSWQTSFDFVEMLQAHMLLRGNAYARIVRSGRRVLELLPLDPRRMSVTQSDDFSLRYRYQLAKGGAVDLDPPDVLHLRGLTLDGVRGVTPIEYAREAFALGMAAEEHGARMFGGRVTGPGVLSAPGRLSDPAYERLKASWRENGGLDNSDSPVILEEGMSWQSLGLKLSDLQFLETRKFQVEEIARLYRMPLHKINSMDKATFSNIEHQSTEYVTDTLLPWARRWEGAISRDLLQPVERSQYYAAFLFKNLLRGDTNSRGEFYRALFNNGALTPNQILEMEDMDGYEGGDIRLVPMNMVPVDLAHAMALSAASKKGGDSVAQT